MGGVLIVFQRAFVDLSAVNNDIFVQLSAVILIKFVQLSAANKAVFVDLSAVILIFCVFLSPKRNNKQVWSTVS
jgi:hypothetical protein